jgi:hypothetical protein
LSDNPPLFGNNLPLWSERGAFRFVAKLLKGRGKASKRGLCVCILTLMRTEFLYRQEEAINLQEEAINPQEEAINPQEEGRRSTLKKREGNRQEEGRRSSRRGCPIDKKRVNCSDK